MTDTLADTIRISVETRYLTEQSDPRARRYAFAYTNSIQHTGVVPVQLLDLHGLITEGNAKVQDVRGEGVIGE